MLTRRQLDQFAADGFLAIPSLVPNAAIQEVRALLNPLFERFGELPCRVKRDLAATGVAGEASVRSAEINRPTLLDRRLKRSEVFRACHAIAAQVAGRAVAYTFDHAIYKAPLNQAETPWHQDHAYTGLRTPLRTVHFWIPLQDATVENGCMHFVPRSHLQGLKAHARHANGHVLSASNVDSSSAKACPLPVGGATIHSPLTLHYTGPNTTSTVRGAWIIHFGPWGRAAKFFPRMLVERFCGPPRELLDERVDRA
jgi:ectoine hydroxylase-related dioxygenase (phytanoyl-CoA dioxygenase family)